LGRIHSQNELDSGFSLENRNGSLTTLKMLRHFDYNSPIARNEHERTLRNLSQRITDLRVTPSHGLDNSTPRSYLVRGGVAHAPAHLPEYTIHKENVNILNRLMSIQDRKKKVNPRHRIPSIPNRDGHRN
jgi:hypothetical protein